MLNRFDVSLVVTSRNLSLAELSQRLGREAQSGSHDKDSLRLKRAPWGISIWRQNSEDSDKPLLERCFEILANIPPKYAELRAVAPEDITASLDIAIFFPTAYVNLPLPHSLIDELAKKRIGLEITGYPVSDDAPQNVPRA